MPTIIEEIPALADAALVIAPALAEVPVIGRLIVVIAQGHGNETHALEQLEEQAKKKKTERDTRIKRNARYVIKASEAMRCVENSMTASTLLLSFGRGILNTIKGSGAGSAPDLVMDRIFTCIEEHVLRQDTPRVFSRAIRGYKRPAKGHGHGR